MVNHQSILSNVDKMFATSYGLRWMRLLLWFSYALLPFTVSAQSTYVSGTFQGAIYVSGPGLSSAVQAQCPADHPYRCDAINQPNYCCPANFYCALGTGQVVGCCPNGQTCSGAAGGGGYSPTSWYPPPTTTTTWYPNPSTTTTYYTGAGVVVVTAANQPTTTTVAQPVNVNNNGQYCSTLTANGAGLPTVRDGGCGKILVVAGASRQVEQWTACLAIFGALNVLGLGLLFA